MERVQFAEHLTGDGMGAARGPVAFEPYRYHLWGGSLDALVLDEGTDWFQPSNLEITDLEVGNPAHNVIPAIAKARISIRFNDTHSGASLSDTVGAIAEKHGGVAKPIISGEPFLTPPGEFSQIIAGKFNLNRATNWRAAFW